MLGRASDVGAIKVIASMNHLFGGDLLKSQRA